MTKLLYRSNSSNLVSRVLLKGTESLTCYHQVLAYDIEVDNSTSILAVPGVLRVLDNILCIQEETHNHIGEMWSYCPNLENKI